MWPKSIWCGALASKEKGEGRDPVCQPTWAFCVGWSEVCVIPRFMRVLMDLVNHLILPCEDSKGKTSLETQSAKQSCTTVLWVSIDGWSFVLVFFAFVLNKSSGGLVVLSVNLTGNTSLFELCLFRLLGKPQMKYFCRGLTQTDRLLWWFYFCVFPFSVISLPDLVRKHDFLFY